MRKLLPVLLLLLLLTACGGVEAPPEDYVGTEDGFRYTKSQLTGQEQYVYDQLLAGLKAQEGRIEGLYPDSAMIERAIRAVDRDYPELFWFSGTGQIETTYLGDRAMEAAYLPDYAVPPAKREEVQAQLEGWMADFRAGLPPGGDQWATALYVYQYIIDHADYTVVEDNSIVNIMVDGQGLCGCYAKTAQYLLNGLGIPCTYITGQAGGETHAWNLMWIDGSPTWMDVTWGDPVYEGADPKNGPSYDYFGLTTEDLLLTHTPDDTVELPVCADESLNYYRHQGLYFETYDTEGLVSALAEAIEQGEAKVSLRFSYGIYHSAVYLLFTEGRVHDLLTQADQRTGAGLDLGGSVWYTLNEERCSLSITIPY